MTDQDRSPNTAAAPKRGERGFTYFDPIESTHGGDVRVSESSAAFEPHIWLRVNCPANLNEPDGPTVEAVRAETPFPVGVRVCSAHNPGSRGTVVSVHRVDGSVGVLWDGYEKSERWSPEALRYVGW